MKYYVVFFWGCVEPQLHGPFDDPEKRDDHAKELWRSNGDNSEHCICRMSVSVDGEPVLTPFINDELDDDSPYSSTYEPKYTYTSVWDNGTELTSRCKFNEEARIVYDVEDSNGDPGDAMLVDEYVTLPAQPGVSEEVLRASDGIIFRYKDDESFEYLDTFFAAFEQYSEHHGKPIKVIEPIWPNEDPDHNDVLLFKVVLTDTDTEIEAHPEECVKSINDDNLVLEIGGKVARTGDQIDPNYQPYPHRGFLDANEDN